MSSFLGVILVSLTPEPPTTGIQSQADVQSRPTLGNSLALISALFGAICAILLKVRMKDGSRVDMQLFFGLFGLFNILFLWPVGLILHLTGAENFELPHTKQAIYATITNVRHVPLLVEKALTIFIRWRLLFQVITFAPSRCLKPPRWSLQLA